MDFKFITTNEDGGNHWRCGDYKIVHYDYIGNGISYKPFSHYQAYFQSKRVESATKRGFRTLEQAMRACEKHNERRAA